jgi:spore coat polysaccharide biosynthesis protein SpsF
MERPRVRDDPVERRPEGGPGAGTGVFVQARLRSQRLPRKVLLPLGDGTVIEQVMRSLRLVGAEVHALLTDRESAPALERCARREGFSLFIGPEEDVLARFCDAQRAFGVRRIIRATGDNPLVSWRLAERILREHREREVDLSHYLGIPLGTGVEVVESAALLRAEAESADPAEREHITTYLYRHPDRFRIDEPSGPQECLLPQVQVTLDTEEDYRLIRDLYRDLYRSRPIEPEEIVTWLRCR